MTDAIELRNSFDDVARHRPKTASWTVRNWTNSDEVAILDIHIVRAGVLMNLYDRGETVEKHYLEMEKKFITLAKRMAIPTSDLDALIWSMMRTTPRIVAQLMLNIETPTRPPKHRHSRRKGLER